MRGGSVLKIAELFVAKQKNRREDERVICKSCNFYVNILPPLVHNIFLVTTENSGRTDFVYTI